MLYPPLRVYPFIFSTFQFFCYILYSQSFQQLVKDIVLSSVGFFSSWTDRDVVQFKRYIFLSLAGFPSFKCIAFFRLSSPLRKNTPFLGFSRERLTRFSLSLFRFNLFWFSLCLISTETIAPLSSRRLSKSLGTALEKLFFSVSCLFRSLRTNKMAACCFYSSGTGGGLEVQQHYEGGLAIGISRKTGSYGLGVAVAYLPMLRRGTVVQHV